MKYILGTGLAIGLVLCFAAVSSLEAAILPSIILGLVGVTVMTVSATLISSMNIDWRE